MQPDAAGTGRPRAPKVALVDVIYAKRRVWGADGNRSKDTRSRHAAYTSDKSIIRSTWLCWFFCQIQMTLVRPG